MSSSMPLRLDIGSGPTEAGCKIIGERLKGSSMESLN
jgi:hypothetical protein